LMLLSLPRVVGRDEEGRDIVASPGRFGPYIKRGDDTRSLQNEEQLLTITLEEALALLAQPKRGRGRQAAEPLAELGVSPDNGAPVKLLAGRYGPYVTDGTTNASLPKNADPAATTLEQAMELLRARAATGPAKRPARKAAGAKKATKAAKTSKSTKKAASGPLPPSPRRVFGSSAYFRLWMAQVVSSLGDWIGLVAVVALAARVSGGSSAAVGLVMAARMVPGFFLAPVGGVLVDRWERRTTMVICDCGRAAIVAILPVVDSLLGLFLASFLLEVLTLLWSPAKDASVPNLVPAEKLAAANSLSMAAAYGTFPLGSAAFASLAGLASWLGHFDALHA